MTILGMALWWKIVISLFLWLAFLVFVILFMMGAGGKKFGTKEDKIMKEEIWKQMNAPDNKTCRKADKN
jgi:hypothetical protein